VADNLRGGKRGAHNASRVEEAVVDQSILDAVLVALPVSAEAVAHGRPPAADARAAAAKEQVVVQLVLLYRWSTADERDGRALDRERDGAIVIRRKDITAEAIVVWLPPNRHTLHKRRHLSRARHKKNGGPTHNVPVVRQIVPPTGAGHEICVAGHLREKEERLAQRHVRPKHVLLLPVQRGALPAHGHVPRTCDRCE
jgi:hypothetical protein